MNELPLAVVVTLVGHEFSKNICHDLIKLETPMTPCLGYLMETMHDLACLSNSVVYGPLVIAWSQNCIFSAGFPFKGPLDI